jgi:predicted dehydrogenase
VDDRTLNKVGDAHPKAKKFNDFRKMLEEMKGSIDAVTVSTPDHCHAAAAAMAMRLGKACFCQKPLTHSIYEARKLGEIARETKVATQMGNQGTANNTLRKAAAVARAGAIGNVKEVHVWTNRPIWPQGGDRPKPQEVPSHLHWDLWIGPAPFRPYGDGYHPFAWRGWWDFGTGALGDMACHTVNMPFMALDLRDPTSVVADTPGHNKESYPKWSIITFEFPANDKRQAVKMVWYDGGKKPGKELFDGKRIDNGKELLDAQEVSETGCLMIGDKGKLFAPGDYAEHGHTLTGGATEPKVDFPNSPGHFEEYVRAIKGGEPAMSNFTNYSGPLTETILLGNLAVWASGKKIEWDAKNLVAKNAPEVAGVIKPEFRSGYTL